MRTRRNRQALFQTPRNFRFGIGSIHRSGFFIFDASDKRAVHFAAIQKQNKFMGKIEAAHLRRSVHD